MSAFGGTASEPQPGRACPLSYRYSPFTLARDAELQAETLYIARGVYGNPYALERILEIAHDDPDRGLPVFLRLTSKHRPVAARFSIAGLPACRTSAAHDMGS